MKNLTKSKDSLVGRETWENQELTSLLNYFKVEAELDLKKL